jgi:CHC2 zinc finger
MRTSTRNLSYCDVKGPAFDVDAEVQRRQRLLLARAQRCAGKVRQGEARPSRWVHVPLADLFGEYNTMHQRGDGLVECGHEPFHTSKSGHCVLINVATGLWWCRSCRQSGDAAAFVMTTKGWSYSQAAQWLDDNYGDLRRAQSHRRRSRRGPIAWRPL